MLARIFHALQEEREELLTTKQSQLAKVDSLVAITKELDCSLAQLALAWCAFNPNVSSVITGATKLSQVSCVILELTQNKKLWPVALSTSQT